MIRLYRILIIQCLLYLSFAPSVVGQEEQKDSLLSVYRETEVDSVKVWSMMEAGKLYLSSNLDSALFYIDSALSLARRFGFERGIAKCLINKSYVYIDQGNYQEALALCESAIPLCNRLNMGLELAATYNNMGNAWNYIGNNWLAIDHYEKSLEKMQEVVVPLHFLIAVKTNLTILYRRLKLNKKALEMSNVLYEEALQIGDTISAAIAALHLGEGYNNLNRSAEARSWLATAIAMAQKISYHLVLASALIQMGDNYANEDRWGEAESRYREALLVAEKSGDKQGQMNSFHGLTSCFFYRKEWPKAREFALRALSLSNDMKLDEPRYDIYLTLSDIELASSDMGRWWQNRRIYKMMRDTFAVQAQIHALQELETKYETEAKEQQIEQLRQEKQIQQLHLQRQNVLFWSVSVLSFLLLATGLLGYRNLTHRRRLVEQEVAIHQQQIKELEQEKMLSAADAVLQGQEEERGRLARDLHDGLGGRLSGIKSMLHTMKGNQLLPKTSAAAFTDVVRTLDQSMEELRSIARNLMPEALLRFGLKDALQDYCDNMKLTSRHLDVRFQAFGHFRRLSQKTELILFRVSQELLNNVNRHAAADKVLIQLVQDDERLSLTVEDNGKGFNPEDLGRVQGVGWMNIRSRVNYLGGTLDLRSKPGEGTSVSIECQLS